MNDGLFKVNNISLLRQSGFNFPLKKIQINNNNLDIFTKILINNKKVEKPFNIYFTPIQKINPNKKNKNNKDKPYPLSEKNKIIRKHNILKKIDFNVNFNKDKTKNNLNIFNNKLTLYNTNNFNLKFRNKINNEIELNLPFVAQTSREKKRDSIKINNISKNLISSSSYNNFQSSNNFTSVNLYRSKNNFNKKYNNIFTNEKIKNTYKEIPGRNKLYIDKEIQTNLDFPKKKDEEKDQNIQKNENIEKGESKETDLNSIKNTNYINLNIKPKKFNITEDNDESSNDLDNMREIENIISKSSLNIHNERKVNNSFNITKNDTFNHRNYDSYNKNNYINFTNNTDKENESKNRNEFILLKNLYNAKYFQNHYNQFYEFSKTSRNIIPNTECNINRIIKKKKSKKNNILNKNINLFNRSNFSKSNLNKRSKIKELDDLMPYKSRILFIKKKKLNDLLDLSYELNNKKRIYNDFL